MIHHEQPPRSAEAIANGAAREAAQPRWPTAISDAVLAALTLCACSQLHDAASFSSLNGKAGAAIAQWQLVAAAALGLAGLAASAGTLRFAGVAAVRPLHELLTRLSMFLTMPTLGLVVVVAYAGYPLSSAAAWGPLLLLLAAYAAFAAFPRQLAPLQPEYTLGVSLFGVLCVFFRACFVLAGRGSSRSAEARLSGWYGLAGSLLLLAAGGVGNAWRRPMCVWCICSRRCGREARRQRAHAHALPHRCSTAGHPFVCFSKHIAMSLSTFRSRAVRCSERAVMSV